ncbi:uncharacterized protein CIMG_13723 [Coccidioides immitis RS]|uniref:Uncharacterized protein n=1 Tax=Coccidioides immitis (strain RS) TaxID=246410 RepID=A0A0D8JW23_COCIM|nr:uncharacterized protein CIMG_13723 [Coccidioides immitis RS]KJF61530.1 hypothetical protein CIMG_13723 [Coccidioides immitis RS]
MRKPCSRGLASWGNNCTAGRLRCCRWLDPHRDKLFPVQTLHDGSPGFVGQRGTSVPLSTKSLHNEASPCRLVARYFSRRLVSVSSMYPYPFRPALACYLSALALRRKGKAQIVSWPRETVRKKARFDDFAPKYP